MLTQDYKFVHQYQQELIQVADQARLVKRASISQPSIKDYFCVRIGNLLISLGLKIKSMSAIREKRLFTELSQECS